MDNTNAVELSQKDLAAGIDLLLERAVDIAVKEMEAPLVVVLDRLVTRVAALSCTAYGKAHTAAQFKACAKTIEAGTFDEVSGENLPH